MVLYLLPYKHEEPKGGGEPHRLESQSAEGDGSELYEIHAEATVDHVTVLKV